MTGMKRKIAAALTAAVILSAAGAHGDTSLLDWYAGNTAGQTEETAGQADDSAYAVPQKRLQLVERKIISPAFSGQAVGKTMVPRNWIIRVTDLMINTESITCPNAVVVDVTDPKGKYELIYISRREFEQRTLSTMGYTAMTEDDKYDMGMMMHTLNYREAGATCDLMAKVLFGEGVALAGEKPLTEDEQRELEEAKNTYADTTGRLYDESGLAQYGMQLMWTDVTQAGRTYTSGEDMITVRAVSAGCELDYSGFNMESKAIMWAMPSIFAIRTPAGDHEAFQEVFDVFCMGTAVSQEFEELRDLNSQRLQQEFMKAQQEGTDYAPSAGSWDDLEGTTVDTGDTYSAIDGWDDVIKGETDYTTGEGGHVKVSYDFDHVFEDENGNIFAGSSADGPPGSMELSPTQIGDAY